MDAPDVREDSQPVDTGVDGLAHVGESIAKSVTERKNLKSNKQHRKLSKRLTHLVLLREQGYDNAEIAAKLKVSLSTLYRLLAQARKAGWDDLTDKLVNHAVPRAVDNVISHLDYESTTPALLKGQNLMTREVLKGVGVLKSHTAAKTESRTLETRVLRVEIALPSGDGGLDTTAPGVMGTPRRAVALPSPIPAPTATHVLEGEVVNG